MSTGYWCIWIVTIDDYKQEMDAISAFLKAEGYFGVSDDAVLGVYNGKPNKSYLIQSLVQMILEKLKTIQQKRLNKR
ncbi:BofC C-terminal domain-containing protein [Niallia taxi]|nr:BofC C-terminal domain-containing protein [Niallia taxi]MDE5052241.1 BofC C-terminal domain-containing protein [Niallia taxi]